MQGFLEKSFYNVSDADMTARNFPAFKHAWFCDDTDNKFRDRFGGLVIKPTSSTTAHTRNADGTLTFAASMNVIETGSWAVPGTKSVLAFVIGTSSSAATSDWDIGSTVAGTNSGLKIGANHLTTDPSRVANGTNVTNGDSFGAAIADTALIFAVAIGIQWNSTTGLKSYRWDGTTWFASAGTDISATGVQLTGLSQIEASVAFTIQRKPTLVAIGYFTTAPTDAEIKAALLYSRARAVESTPRHLLWPGFIGRV